MPETRMKRVTLIRGIDNNTLDGCTIGAAISALKVLQKDYRLKDHTNIRLATEQREYEDGWELNVIGERPEHETETKAREKDAARQERFDRARLAELRKKYPD